MAQIQVWPIWSADTTGQADNVNLAEWAKYTPKRDKKARRDL